MSRQVVLSCLAHPILLVAQYSAGIRAAKQLANSLQTDSELFYKSSSEVFCIPYPLSLFSFIPILFGFIFLPVAINPLRILCYTVLTVLSWFQPAHYRLVKASFNLVAELATASSASWHLWNRRSRTLRSLYILYLVFIVADSFVIWNSLYRNSYQFILCTVVIRCQFFGSAFSLWIRLTALLRV